MNYKLYLTIIFGLASFFSVVLSPNAAELKDIRFEGELKKTKESTVLKIIRFHPGDDIEREDLRLIRQRLMRSGLFVNESVKAELSIDEREEALLSLNLYDRHSMMVIPVVAASSDTLMGGLFVMDRNLFGTGNSLFTAGMFSEESQIVSLGYTAARIGDGYWDLGGTFNFGNGTRTISSVDGRTDLREFDYTSYAAGMNLHRNFRRGKVVLSGEIEGSDYDFIDDWVIAYRPGIAAILDWRSFGRFMSEGFRADLSYDLSLYSTELDTGHHIGTELSWQGLFAPRIQVEALGRALYYQGDERLSPRVNSSILPKTVQADSSYMGRLGLQFVLADFSWGYLGLPLGYEMGVLDGVSGEGELFHGPSAGLSLFLKKVAMPAISLNYGYNLAREQYVAMFSMGF